MLLTLSDNLKNPIEEIEISRSFNKRNIPRNISKFVKSINIIICIKKFIMHIE